MKSACRLLGAFALVVGVSAVPVARVAACDCMAMGPDESATFADAVFTGAAIAEAPGPAPALREGAFPMGGQVLYTFAVDGVAKGNVGAEAQVLAGGDQGACGMTFALNERWLIFATAEAGMLTTHLCAGNLALRPGEDPPLAVTAPTATGSEGPVPGVPVGVLLPMAAVVALAGVSAFLFWRAERPS
ncbi:MAG: hypothetical protein ABI841_07585 [Chloroflexota bacterium]